MFRQTRDVKELERIAARALELAKGKFHRG
jgi:hypothetical protein